MQAYDVGSENAVSGHKSVSSGIFFHIDGIRVSWLLRGMKRALPIMRMLTLLAVSISTSPGYASQRKAELVAFREVSDGAVIDVGRSAAKPAIPALAPQGLSPEALQSDFLQIGASGAQDQPIDVGRSSIPVPLWMQTGRVMTGAALIAQSVVAPYMYSPSACTMTPYRPRGDLAPWQEARRARYFPLISAVACEAGVPTGLFDALVAQESRYDPLIVSNKGAVGLTQLMPDTARGLGVLDSRDPLANLRGGARYLRSHLDEFKRVDLALAAYNAGPGRVRTLGRIPPFRETIDYVAAITKGWSSGAYRAASVQTAAMPSAAGWRGRGVQLLAYTSTSVPNPR